MIIRSRRSGARFRIITSRGLHHENINTSGMVNHKYDGIVIGTARNSKTREADNEEEKALIN